MKQNKYSGSSNDPGDSDKKVWVFIKKNIIYNI